MNFHHFINLLRVNNYIKNLLIFFPLFLNYSYWNIESYLKLFFPFIFFSLLTSSVYIINDIFDLEADKIHKHKKFRPISSGVIKPKLAIFLACILAIISFIFFSFYSELKVLLLVLLYFIINLLYSLVIKKIKYLDLFAVSFGFVIRVYLGSLITSLTISNFFISQIILFSLFILICKRREVFFTYNKNIVSKYSIKELNFFSIIFLFLNIVNYLFYCYLGQRFTESFSLEISFLIFSIIMNRYFKITFMNKKFDPVLILLEDNYLIFLSFVYVINFILGFYGLF